MGETWAFCHGCAASTEMKASPKDAEAAWNTRYEKPRHHVMVVGDSNDRTPLTEAINQIGFDGIIIAEGPPPEVFEIKPLEYTLPDFHTRAIPQESNAQRCGYSTKRK